MTAMTTLNEDSKKKRLLAIEKIILSIVVSVTIAIMFCIFPEMWRLFRIILWVVLGVSAFICFGNCYKLIKDKN